MNDNQDPVEVEDGGQAELVPTEGHETQDELTRIKELARQHGPSLAIAVGVVIAAVVGIAVMRQRGAQRADEAVEMLSASRTTDDLETLMETHPKSPVASLAMMKAAKHYFDVGNYGAARDKYAAFAEAYPEHPFAPAAAQGIIQCAEARGLLQDALAQYTDFIARYPDHFVTSQAVFGRARCLEQLERLDEAREVYETFIEEQPENGGWVPMAEELLMLLEKKIARAEKLVAQPTTDEAPTVESTVPSVESTGEAVEPPAEAPVEETKIAPVVAGAETVTNAVSEETAGE